MFPHDMKAASLIVVDWGPSEEATGLSHVQMNSANIESHSTHFCSALLLLLLEFLICKKALLLMDFL